MCPSGREGRGVQFAASVDVDNPENYNDNIFCIPAREGTQMNYFNYRSYKLITANDINHSVFMPWQIQSVHAQEPRNPKYISWESSTCWLIMGSGSRPLMPQKLLNMEQVAVCQCNLDNLLFLQVVEHWYSLTSGYSPENVVNDGRPCWQRMC